MVAQRTRINPYGPEHYQLADTLLQMCAETSAYCDLLDKMGLDTTAARAENAAHQKVAEVVKGSFAPTPMD